MGTLLSLVLHQRWEKEVVDASSDLKDRARAHRLCHLRLGERGHGHVAVSGEGGEGVQMCQRKCKRVGEGMGEVMCPSL